MIKRILLISLGWLAVILGAVGIFLPILPTTPFVLCAAACFSASSPRLRKWLEESKYFGEYIRNYRDRTGISRRTRVTGIVFLWATLSVSALLVSHLYVRVVLAIVGISVTIHLLLIGRRPKARSGPPALSEEEDSW